MDTGALTAEQRTPIMGTMSSKGLLEDLRQAVRARVGPGLSQAELGRQVGIDAGQLCRWLQGQTRLAQESLEALADYLDLELRPRGGARRSRR